jgi:uridine phosphorylase
MPRRLRPTAPNASDAIVVGDPGRALLLAQELLAEPKMSNHARGLWGYSGTTPAGRELTIQATGMGGPSAVLVLGDMAELGVRRLVRVGTCVGLDRSCKLGELLLVTEAVAAGGSAGSLGVGASERVGPSAALTERLGLELGDDGRAGAVSSFDLHPAELSRSEAGAIAADMQTAPLLARARALGVEAAAVLIVGEIAEAEDRLEADSLEAAEKRAGRAASAALSG